MRRARKAVSEAAPVCIAIGLIALDRRSSALLDGCWGRFEDYLRTTFARFDWSVRKIDRELQWSDPLPVLDWAQAIMEEQGLQFCFVFTGAVESADVDRSPVTLSFSHSAALIDISRLAAEGGGAEGEGAARRSCHLMLACLARLNGLPHLDEQAIASQDLDGGVPLSPEEISQLDGALQSLAGGILRHGVKEIKGLALYARVFFTQFVRVLRAVMSHRPLRMVFRLSKLMFASMAALVLALLSVELWYLGVGINIWRLALIAVAALLAATSYVVFRQDLYVHRVSRSLSEQAAFFNLTSFLTVFSVLLVLFAIIFAVTLLVSTGVYPRYIVERWVMRNEVGLSDYLRVSLLISSMAMVVGALGAGLEESEHFRQVMYTEKKR